MAFGTVYIFNLYNDPATLTQLNGQSGTGSSIAVIPAPAKGDQAPYWVPPQTSLPRTNQSRKELTAPLFVNVGDSDDVNDLSINYGGQGWDAKFSIPNPPQPRLETDLWLYLAYEQAFLFDAVTGALVPQPDGRKTIDLKRT